MVACVLVPRVRPNFPGRRLGFFIGAGLVLFAAQLSAVLLLARNEKAPAAEAGAQTTQTTPSQTTPTQTTPTQTTPTQTTPTQTTPTQTTPTQTAPAQAGDPVAGKKVFLAQPCHLCHTLADAGATGTIGPNLDQKMPPYALIIDRVTNGKSPGGGKPAMPSFKGILTPQQIQDVAAYVSSVAGKK